MLSHPSPRFCASTLTAAVVLAATSALSFAAPTITRLTPPSALFSFNDANPPIIARFIQGQRFDLQATIIPDAGQNLSSVVFSVNGSPVSGTVTQTNILSVASIAVTNGGSGYTVAPSVAISGGSGATATAVISSGVVTAVNVTKSGNGLTATPTVTFSGGSGTGAAATAVTQRTAVSAALRAYANTAVGTPTFSVTATQDDSLSVTRTGNFEIVATPTGGKKAKNVIIMIGDGMGASHRTAARIVKNGVQQGKANAPLSMDLFPVTGMVQTSSLNSIVTDSAPGAACYSTGNKSNNNQQGVFPDDSTDNNGDNPRVELIGEFLARTQGKALGIVTTADVFDATPGAFGSHTQARGSGTGICDYYLDEAVPKANLSVLLGGGRKWFLPSNVTGTGRSNSTDYVYPADVISAWGLPTAGSATDSTRNLLSDFQSAGFTYASDRTSLNGISAGTTKLLGLFALSNMNVAFDKINGRRGGVTPLNSQSVVAGYGFPDQPMLDEMTAKALQVLSQSPNGFVLMVEGASIDKQAHNMDTERWILDTLEFDYAIETVRQFVLNAGNGETLAVITADHECAGVAVIGASLITNSALATRATSGGGAAQLRSGVVGTYEAAGFPDYPRASTDDGYPATMDVDFKMLVGYASNADRYEDWLTNPLPLKDSQQPTSGTSYGTNQSFLPNLPIDRDVPGNFFITGQVADTTAVHTAGDIPISAIGRGARLFTGYQDNTDVFFKTMQAAIGGAVK